MAPAVVSMSLMESLQSFEDSTQAASEALPPTNAILPPENGISLLDAKNEIFLSYLQSLALRNLEVIRSVRQYLPSVGDRKEAIDRSQKLQDDVVDSLVRQRVYLEKGVRPLEERLKYTIDKTIRAVDEEDRRAKQAETAKTTKEPKHSRKSKGSGSEEDEEDSESSSSEEEDESNLRPNLASLAAPLQKQRTHQDRDRASRDDKKGVYRPPRINATSMPEPSRREDRKSSRPQRSHTLDEYVSTELASGPTAEPSIGANITQGGRRQMSARERAADAEKREYEETHLTRLMEGKKEKKANRARDGGFGGEDWKGLGEGLDRIADLTKGKREGKLERSRKRKETEDGPRGDGSGGRLFDRRKKRMMRKLK